MVCRAALFIFRRPVASGRPAQDSAKGPGEERPSGQHDRTRRFLAEGKRTGEVTEANRKENEAGHTVHMLIVNKTNQIGGGVHSNEKDHYDADGSFYAAYTGRLRRR